MSETSVGRDKSLPLLFISHNEEDSNLASILRRFVLRETGGQVQVFQSTDRTGGARIGTNLNKELAELLYEAEVVFLICSAKESDTAYVMWETGVATNPDPSRPDTTIIVLATCGEVPSPVDEKVRVDLRKKDDLNRFVSQFLTSKHIFPSLDRPVTNHDPDSEVVRNITDELFNQLQADEEFQPERSWTVWASAVIAFPRDAIESFKGANDRMARATDLMMQHAVLASFDNGFPSLLGRLRLENECPLSTVLGEWKADNSEANHVWMDDLARQLIGTACNAHVTPQWSEVISHRSKCPHTPLLVHFSDQPRRRRTLFEIHFPRLSDKPVAD